MTMRPIREYYSEVEGPTGPILLVSDGEALTGLYHRGQKWGREPGGSWLRDQVPALRVAAEQLAAYFAGESRDFNLPVSTGGTEFQRRVWGELLAIPFGETITYVELARRVGSPKAVRAVGAAVGRNPASIVIPCHRVVGSDGKLTGYAGGISRKHWLLEHERAARARLLRGVSLP